MDGDRRQRLRALLASDGRGDESLAPRVCALAVSELSVAGAGLSVLAEAQGDGHRGLVHASGPVTERLEDLQMTVGEGPCLLAHERGSPVLVPDLSVERTRWPGFAPAALELGAAAVFSFPLQVGAARLGVLDLHRDRATPLSSAEIADALLLADNATQAVLDGVTNADVEDLSWIADMHASVHQASGMVTVQLGVGMQDALLRLRAHAYAREMPLAEVARQVVDRTLRLEIGD